MSPVKVKRPETWNEAAEFGRTKAQYLRAGLCHSCAAQASYGHQHGWSAVHPPCRTCTPLVSTFTGMTETAWRYVPKGDRRGPVRWSPDAEARRHPAMPATTTAFDLGALS